VKSGQLCTSKIPVITTVPLAGDQSVKQFIPTDYSNGSQATLPDGGRLVNITMESLSWITGLSFCISITQLIKLLNEKIII
jgi:hypothetical protein